MARIRIVLELSPSSTMCYVFTSLFNPNWDLVEFITSVDKPAIIVQTPMMVQSQYYIIQTPNSSQCSRISESYDPITVRVYIHPFVQR